ncbi:MAG: hypothetical protein ACLQG3_15400 [Terracidiphilus sp.]
MKRIWLIAALWGLAGVATCGAQSPWEQPAADLAEQIAGILGPGPAHLTIRNLSSIPSDEIPAIRKLLAQDLKAHGVVLAGADSANSIRVTLSQDWLDGLWVAEVVEGNQTQVTMIRVGVPHGTSSVANAMEPITLRKQLVWSKSAMSPPLPALIEDPVLAAVGTNAGLVVLTEDGGAVYATSLGGWAFVRRFQFPERTSLPRDPRGILISSADGNGFTAFTAGLECAGSYATPTDPAAKPRDGWTFQCHASDDPWPLSGGNTASGAPKISAFYNAARNYFTGVVTPSMGVDLPPFYELAIVPRAAGSGALLVGGIDGKVQLAENNALHPVAGTRDWGSDFAVLDAACGARPVVVASGSGEAANDSLRAYSLPALEAVPASAPLAVDGTVTALWTAPDGKSVLAVVRNAANQYEVDRVTALCN